MAPKSTIPGFVLLDKEAGETSFKALFPLKRVFCTKRVGHAGTLDLRASGLIIAATGRATRLLPYVEAKEKCYSFRLHLGYETDTLEWDGDVLEQDERVVGREDVERMLSQFVGDIEQIPPKYCAVKINGVRASDLMERGRNVELKPRKIHIESLELLGEADGADPTCTGKCMAAFDLVCVCSKGTYIRALGRDIGRALGTFGCVSRIRRLRIGHVTLDRAVKGADLTAADLVPVDQVLEFPVVRMGDAELASIRNGNWIPWKAPVENVGPEGRVFAANRDGEVLSLCKYEPGRILADVYLAEDG